LEARNRIVHHFFIRNIDAFLYDNVLEAALSALRDDGRKLSACLILVHNVYERLCKALHIDSDKIVVRSTACTKMALNRSPLRQRRLLALAADGRRDNLLFVRQGVRYEAETQTVRQVPSRPQLSAAR